MDLNELQNEKDELIVVGLLYDEEGKPTDGFKVVGSNSTEYQEADRLWKVRNVKKSAARGRAVEAVTDAGATELVDQVSKREFALVSACIKEIFGFTVAGAPAPLNHETLKTIFTKRPTWCTKVLNAIEAEQIFTKASSAPGAK